MRTREGWTGQRSTGGFPESQGDSSRPGTQSHQHSARDQVRKRHGKVPFQIILGVLPVFDVCRASEISVAELIAITLPNSKWVYNWAVQYCSVPLFWKWRLHEVHVRYTNIDAVVGHTWLISVGFLVAYDGWYVCIWEICPRERGL